MRGLKLLCIGMSLLTLVGCGDQDLFELADKAASEGKSVAANMLLNQAKILDQAMQMNKNLEEIKEILITQKGQNNGLKQSRNS